MEQTHGRIGSQLAGIIKGQVFTDVICRSAYSADASIYRILPDCVVVPCSIEDIAAVIRYAAENNIKAAARGAGSGVAGESLCSGIVLDTRQYLNQIIGSDDDGQTVTMQPGVVLDELNLFLARFGRKIGPDPSTSNRACIGGCVANNSTGAHSLQYGYMADYVEAVEAVLADGSIVEFKNYYLPGDSSGAVDRIARRCVELLIGKQDVIRNALPKTKRNRCGYNIAGICRNGRIDLAGLLAGSEGTLAVFTKIKLRTVPLPRVKALLELQFESLAKMAEAVPLIVASGASACELMDRRLLNMAAEALPKFRDILPTEAEAVLLVEHTGERSEEVSEKIEKTTSLVRKLTAGSKAVFDIEQQKRLWKARKDAVPLLDRKKGRKHPIAFIEDVSVGNNRLAEYISNIERIAAKQNVEVTFHGHAGDGELHIRPYLDLGQPEDIKKMESIAEEVFSVAWTLGGSISGEHAVGLLRSAFIKRQYGEEYYRVLKEIKNIFDPAGIMNPGKIINDDKSVMTKSLRAENKFLPQVFGSDLIFDKDELEFELGQCNGCGLCLSREAGFRMCPVFRAVNEELASPRAKANILNLRAGGKISDEDFGSKDFKRFLDLCINCKLCSVECPAGVDVSKLTTAARTRFAGSRGLKIHELVLTRNRKFNEVGSKLSIFSNCLMKVLPSRWLLEKTVGLDRRRRLPPFESGSFLDKGRKFLGKCWPIKRPVERVAYFVDTFVNYNDHKIGFAVLDCLRFNGIEVILPDQRPVPLPAACYGDINTVKKDLQYTVANLARVVRAGYKILCSEPSAALFLKNELRHYIDTKDAKLVSDNTYELMNFLLGLFRAGKLKPLSKVPSGNFAYHSPCHLIALGGSATVELFEKWLGLKVTDLDAGCCGLAGTFGMQKKNYDLSERISENLALALSQGKADTILTECSACRMQVEHISNKKAVHPIKVLVEYYEDRQG